MSEHWFIDGWNFFYSLRRDSSAQASFKDVSQMALKMESYAAREGEWVTLVFDGRPLGERWPKSAHLEILECEKGQNADAVLERLFESLTAPQRERSTLVSDDRVLRQMAVGSRIKTMTTSKFRELLVHAERSKLKEGVDNTPKPFNNPFDRHFKRTDRQET